MASVSDTHLNTSFDRLDRELASWQNKCDSGFSQLKMLIEISSKQYFYDGEVVHFKTAACTGVGFVLDKTFKKVDDRECFHYTVSSDGIVYKDIPAVHLKRSEELVQNAACSRRSLVAQSPASVMPVVDVPRRKSKKPVENPQEDLFSKRRSCSEWKCGVYEFLIKMLLILLVIGSVVTVLKWPLYSIVQTNSIERSNDQYADDAIYAMREMNAMTANQFWKRLVADEKINLADPSALEGIAHLFMFESTRSNRTTLREYVDRMPTNPPAIFFAFGESTKELEELPAVRSLIEDGHEVLLLTDPLDRKALQSITWFEGKTLMDARWYEHSKRADASQTN
ncbi:Molecular chaperone HtpG [Aphelenchoides fujianensis]|nr:Molecular chaperone HtpG [Aphelenchoides fujianensis]